LLAGLDLLAAVMLERGKLDAQGIGPGPTPVQPQACPKRDFHCEISDADEPERPVLFLFGVKNSVMLHQCSVKGYVRRA